MGRGSARRSALGAAVVVALLAAGCQRLVPTYDGSTGGPLGSAVLTPDGYDTYTFTGGRGTMAVYAARRNRGENLRALFWPQSAPAVADGQTCGTWRSQQGGLVQQGAALRVRRSSDGRLRALTVTKNIVWGAGWNLNFHTWDTARDGLPAQRFAYVSLPRLRDLPLPWDVCARVIGRTIEVKVWGSGRREPAWGDRDWSGRAEVPRGWSPAGAFGWYVGHLPPGGAAHFDRLRTWSIEPAGRSRSDPPAPPVPGATDAGPLAVAPLPSGPPPQ